MSRPFLARMLTPEECSTELSTILEAKWLSLRSLPAPESSSARVAREAAEAYTREVLAPHLVAEGYGPELCEYPKSLASHGLFPVDGAEPGASESVGPGMTPAGSVAGGADSWDMPPEELNHTAALPRETPAYWGRDRGDFDPLDDKSDINPHSRTEKP